MLFKPLRYLRLGIILEFPLKKIQPFFKHLRLFRWKLLPQFFGYSIENTLPFCRMRLLKKRHSTYLEIITGEIHKAIEKGILNERYISFNDSFGNFVVNSCVDLFGFFFYKTLNIFSEIPLRIDLVILFVIP